MSKKSIVSKNVPAAIGPFSHACEANGFVFISGQLGIDRETGQFEPTVEAQAEMSLRNTKAILRDVGLDMPSIVKTTIFLADIKDFATVNAVYAKYFDGEYPARSCIAVKALPLGGLVEIESIAVR
jgi:2-iminobutanoate/2-iminopropanoate deaminase